jgi:hypothetical protein
LNYIFTVVELRYNQDCVESYGEKYFTKEEVKDLSGNQYVENVSKKSIRYSIDFKKLF